MNTDQGTVARHAWRVVEAVANSVGDPFLSWGGLDADVKSRFAAAMWEAYETSVPPDYEVFSNFLYEAGWREGRYSNDDKLIVFAGHSAFSKMLFTTACHVAISTKDI